MSPIDHLLPLVALTLDWLGSVLEQLILIDLLVSIKLQSFLQLVKFCTVLLVLRLMSA